MGSGAAASGEPQQPAVEPEAPAALPVFNYDTMSTEAPRSAGADIPKGRVVNGVWEDEEDPKPMAHGGMVSSTPDWYLRHLGLK